MISWKYFIGFGIILYLRTGFCFKCYVRTNDICGKSIDLKTVETKDCQATCVLLKFKMHDSECVYRDCLNYGKESCKHYVGKMQHYFGNSFEAKRCKQCYTDRCNGNTEEIVRPVEDSNSNSDDSSSYSFSIVSVIKGVFSVTEPNENSIDYFNKNQHVDEMNKQDSITTRNDSNLKTTKSISNEIDTNETITHSNSNLSDATLMTTVSNINKTEQLSSFVSTTSHEENFEKNISKDEIENMIFTTASSFHLKDTTSEIIKNVSSSTSEESISISTNKPSISEGDIGTNKVEKRETRITESLNKETIEIDRKTNSGIRSTMEYSTKEASTVESTLKEVSSKLFTVSPEVNYTNNDIFSSKSTDEQTEFSTNYKRNVIQNITSTEEITSSPIINYKTESLLGNKMISDNSYLSISTKSMTNIDLNNLTNNTVNHFSDKISESSTTTMIDTKIKNDINVSENRSIYDTQSTQMNGNKKINTDTTEMTNHLNISTSNLNDLKSSMMAETPTLISNINLYTTESSSNFIQSDHTTSLVSSSKQENITEYQLNSSTFEYTIYTDSTSNTNQNYTITSLISNSSDNFITTNGPILNNKKDFETTSSPEVVNQTILNFKKISTDIPITSTDNNHSNVDKIQSTVTEKINSYFTKSEINTTEQFRVNLLENTFINNITNTLYNITLHEEGKFTSEDDKVLNKHHIDTKATTYDDSTVEETVETSSSITIINSNSFTNANTTLKHSFDIVNTTNSLVNNFMTTKASDIDVSPPLDKSSKKIESEIITPKVINITVQSSLSDSNVTKYSKETTVVDVFTRIIKENNLKESVTIQSVVTSIPTVVNITKKIMKNTSNQQYLTENPTKAFLNTESQKNTSSHIQNYNFIFYLTLILLLMKLL